MDICFLHLSILCVSIALAFVFFTRKKLSAHENLPPGRTGWPILGEMWDFVMASRYYGDPYKFVRDRMAKHSPVLFKTRLLGEKMVVFCGAEGNKFLFSNENKHVKSWWPASTSKVFGSPEDQDEAKFRNFTLQVRTSLVGFMKPEFLREYAPIMDAFAEQHVETNWSRHEQVKVSPLVRMYTFNLLCNLFLNVKETAVIERLLDPFLVVRTGIFSMPIDLPGTAFNRASKASKIIREQLVEIIKKRRKELQENIVETSAVDLLTRMLRQAGDDVNEMGMACEFMGSLVVGYGTTSLAIASIVYYLGKYPNVYDMVFQEQMAISNSKSSGELLNWDDVQQMKYSWWVVCEVLRLAPLSGTFREVKSDFQFAGFTIPKGWKAHWTPTSTHKDPKYFPNPEDFDPLRFEGSGPLPFSFVPFGGGPRMCPGREFGRLAILTFIHNLVTKFKFKSVNPHQKIIYTPPPTPTPSMMDGLLMELQSV